MGNPKEDCEALMNALLPLAERMLKTYGEFYPYGGAMRSNGEIVDIAGYDGNEHPRSVDVIALIKYGLIEAARNGDLSASAVVYDVRVATREAKEKSDAVAISLNHRDDYSIIVYVPYKIEGGTLAFGTTFAEKGEADIFSADPPA